MNAKGDRNNAYEYICRLIQQNANEHTYRMRCVSPASSQNYALRLNWTTDSDGILYNFIDLLRIAIVFLESLTYVSPD